MSVKTGHLERGRTLPTLGQVWLALRHREYHHFSYALVVLLLWGFMLQYCPQVGKFVGDLKKIKLNIIIVFPLEFYTEAL